MAKRDELRQLEKDIQRAWEENNVYEWDAPADGEELEPKFMATFPYPYMNGRLHLGHSFTVTKAEYTTRFQRLLKKRAIFPFGLHCTGMPIKACADKLKREIETFGNPPVFPVPVKEETPVEEVKVVVQEDPTKHHSSKSKLKSKTGTQVYQWQIMESLGVSPDEIPNFTDAQYWLTYFPPYAKSDLKLMGACIDWRRSFITTDKNPYYDSFVRWHFETLRDLDKIGFGKRYSIWSPSDNQPCADHDRASGEGVQTQEYTLIKMKVVELKGKIAELEPLGLPVYLVPATMRPETMYGQTNCWALPEGDYGAFEIEVSEGKKEIFVCAAHSARNLSYQGFSSDFGVQGRFKKVADLKGSDLIGLKVAAPLSTFEHVYVLPMSTISMEKGTGVVTSVPSDSPDDYTTLKELRTKPVWRERLNVQDDWVMPFDQVAIIETPKGKFTAQTFCEEFKVNGVNDRDNLAKAKDQAYKIGFNFGTMDIGEFKGVPVKDAKPLIRQKLIDQGLACPYYEPASKVISRSGDECVVCLAEQWYIKYGEEDWKAKTSQALEAMECYHPESRNMFRGTLDWLAQWACSRTYGLGTRLPWDPKYLIESLSDSTVYMAYYAVAHLLQDGVFDGSVVGKAGIKADQLNRKVWDYIFLGKEYPAGETDIPEATLKTLRHEFQYWYPVDIRVSGKDLIQNHLTFFLYNHTAIFPEAHWPKSVRANGHILLNNKKMSKSEGNFLTLEDAVEKFSADGMRFALADAGDAIDDANFSVLTANKAILRLFTELRFVEEVVELLAKGELVQGPPSSFFDKVFENEMYSLVHQTRQHYERTNFREALLSGFYGLQAARDLYRERHRQNIKLCNASLIQKWIEIQTIVLSPICPHWSERVWQLLKKDGFVVRNAVWPEVPVPDQSYLDQSNHIEACIKEFRSKIGLAKSRKKDGPITKATIWVASSYPAWRATLIDAIRTSIAPDATVFPTEAEIKNLVKADANLRKVMGVAAPVIVSVAENLKTKGLAALDEALVIAVNEKDLIGSITDYFESRLAENEKSTITVEVREEDGTVNKKTQAVPMAPIITFE